MADGNARQRWCGTGALRVILRPWGFSLPQIVICRAKRSARRPVGIEILLGDGRHATFVAHLDELESLTRVLIHPVFFRELGGDALNDASDAKGLAAADAAKRLFRLENPR
jgi:hypothetical protein